MRIRIIADKGYFRPQYKTLFGWGDIWHKGDRRFLTEKEAGDAVRADMYPDGKVFCDSDWSL